MTHFLLLLCIGSVIGLVFPKPTAAQTADAQRLEPLNSRLTQVRTLLERLPRVQQRILSSGALSLLKLSRSIAEQEAALKSLAPADLPYYPPPQQPTDASDGDMVTPRVSDPSNDFTYSIVSGFTQSETSTAWCGNQVVTGFNDSGSVAETLLFGKGGLSFSGASFSSNRGGSFQDIGPINPGPDVNTFLGGDPVVTCVPGLPAVFYYSQILQGGPSSAPISGVGISRSVTGGASWSNPITAVAKNGFTHFVDKPWSTIDPTNRNNLFVTYTDFDVSGVACGFDASGSPIQRTAIELVRSTDGGSTWTTPQVIVQACDTAPSFRSVQGSQVAVDPLGGVYVAWEDFLGASGTTRDLRITRSTNHGLTFGASVLITSVAYTGDGNLLQGGVRNNEFPSLAIGPVSNNLVTLYVVWNDGRSLRVRDLEAGLYGYADIFISRSTNSGANWSTPSRVNADPVSHGGLARILGTDHFQPGIAIDKTGSLGVCWYDRSADPLNFQIGRTCAVSPDAGASWTYSSYSRTWPPFHDLDAFVAQYYLGDYDTVATDNARVTAGFRGAFGVVSAGDRALMPNQDVRMFLFGSSPTGDGGGRTFGDR